MPGNFINECIEQSILNESCILGSCVLIFSLYLLFISIKAFYKMTKVYKKLNFENFIISLSIAQNIILLVVLLSLYDFAFEAFFLVQIFIISLIIRKFIILATDSKTFYEKNIIFILLNSLNVIIFSIYPIYLKSFKGHHLYVKLFYRIFHAITTFILTYYCCFFVKLSANISQKSDYLLYKSNITNTKKKEKDEENKKDEEKIEGEGEIFYKKKSKQITYLYSVNLLCAFIEICFSLTRNFIIDESFVKDEFRTIPQTFFTNIIYYIYLFICFINVGVNYMCFYYTIRHQYSEKPKIEKKPGIKIIDIGYIEQQKNKENSDDIKQFLDSYAQSKEENPVTVEIKSDEESAKSSEDNNVLLPRLSSM